MLLFFESLLLFIVVLLIYLQVARKFYITDQPNYRSAHAKITVTGAGFIFPLAFLLPLLITGNYIHYRAMLFGLFLLTCISYMDDLHALKKLPRVFIQTIAVGLLLWQTGGLFKMTLWSLIPAFIFVVGIINAYNFMDGINGITGFYSLAIIGTLFFLSQHGYPKLPVQEVFICLIAALVAFLFFNARKTASMFCGDAGSITIGFIISFLIIQMMIQDDNGKWILLIGVYGLDAVATITLRIIRRENIGEAHKTHFYQYLVSVRKKSQILVSMGYTIVQLAINWLLIFQTTIIVIVAYVIIILMYVLLRLRLEGYRTLFGRSNS